jgi:hypothetical protein
MRHVDILEMKSKWFAGWPEAPDKVRACEAFWAELMAKGKAMGATAMIMFQNIQMDSSTFGEQTMLFVGPTCTYKTPDAIPAGYHIYDLPSQRQYPECWTEMEQIE